MEKITVKYGKLRKMMKMLKKTNQNDDTDVSFEFIVGSCFPNILENIKAEIRNQYTIGYTQGLKEGKQKEEKENSVE